jgi:hypothetical protein
MWDEISRIELPKSRIFVIFWSKNYVLAEGCVREITQAKELFHQGQLRPIVLRLDEFPIIWGEELGESSKPAFESLRILLDYRTSSPRITVQQAIDLVQRVAEPILGSDHPRLPRHDLQQTLRNTVQKDRFTFYPATWVSGFNGVGRETLIRDFNRSFVPNGRGIVIEVKRGFLTQTDTVANRERGFRGRPRATASAERFAGRR